MAPNGDCPEWLRMAYDDPVGHVDSLGLFGLGARLTEDQRAAVQSVVDRIAADPEYSDFAPPLQELLDQDLIRTKPLGDPQGTYGETPTHHGIDDGFNINDRVIQDVIDNPDYGVYNGRLANALGHEFTHCVEQSSNWFYENTLGAVINSIGSAVDRVGAGWHRTPDGGRHSWTERGPWTLGPDLGTRIEDQVNQEVLGRRNNTPDKLKTK